LAGEGNAPAAVEAGGRLLDTLLLDDVCTPSLMPLGKGRGAIQYLITKKTETPDDAVNDHARSRVYRPHAQVPTVADRGNRRNERAFALCDLK
jgi:hypothetical protein